VVGLPDPCKISFHECLRILNNGQVEAWNDDGKKLKLVLRLDSEENVILRSRWMRTLELLSTKEPTLYREYMGFPNDLPDLRQKQVPANTKPAGVENCYFE
jgi:hypothetical protein